MKTSDLLVSDLCGEIDLLKLRLSEAENDAKYWRGKYAELQNESIAHGHHMIGMVLSEILSPTLPNNGR